jgi:competence protein ComEC
MRAHRPSISLLAAVWLGLVCGNRLSYSLLLTVVLVGILAVCIVLAASRRIRFLLLVAAFFLLALVRSPDSEWNRGRIPPDLDSAHAVPVVLRLSLPIITGECTQQAVARVSKVIAGPYALRGERVMVRGIADLERPAGRDLTVTGTFSAPKPRLNPCGPDKLGRALRQHTVGTVDVGHITEAGGGGSIPGLLRFRKRLEDLIRKGSERRTVGMLEALLLGQRSSLSPKVQSQMVKAGTYHVLAISGLHVGIVLLVTASFLSTMRLPRRVRIVTALVIVLGYVVFTGGRPSAQRAAAFFALVSLSRLLEWKVDYPNLVCAAGTGLLLAFPHLAWDVGFKLSLGAVFGITLLVPQLTPGKVRRASLGERLKAYVLTGVAASFSAQVLTLPVLLYHFGRVSLLGPISNLAVLPLVMLVVTSGIEAAIALLMSPALALILVRSASTVASVILDLVAFATDHLPTLVYTGRPSVGRILVYSGALAYLCLARPGLRRRYRILLLVTIYGFLVCPFPGSSDGQLRLTFIYVGDGDACLVEIPGGKRLLIDAGAGGHDFDAGSAYVLPLLALRGIGTIDAAVITHSHNDHYGGFTTLLDNVTIKRILIGTVDGEEGYQALLANARRRGADVLCIGRGDTLSFGPVRIEVLHPQADDIAAHSDDPNALSVVLKLTYGAVSVLFTGDMTPSVQKRLVDLDADLRCDVLKVPHHGAPEALYPEFLSALGARAGIISVGHRFASHPCPQTVGLLQDRGIATFTTVSDGAVTVTTDGRYLRITAESAAGVRHLSIDLDPGGDDC